MTSPVRFEVAPADPSLWSEQSQRSVCVGWTKEYRDIKYQCWRCTSPAVFTAQDQKYAFEVKKAPIDQHRILCNECWRQSLEIRKELVGCAEQWADSKVNLAKDKAFLARWLGLLELLEKFVPYRTDTAKKNMIKMLLLDG
jgi:Probable zinc-ribbon domain